MKKRVRIVPWEETDNNIRQPVSNKQFEQKCGERLLQKEGMKVYGLFCKLRGQAEWALRSLRFSKEDGWTIAKAKAWYADHPDLREAQLTEEELESFMKDNKESEHYFQGRVPSSMSLLEAEFDEKKRMITAVALRVGWSKNVDGPYYTEEAVKSLASLLKENRKISLNHESLEATKQKFRMPRDMRDWIGTAKEAWYDTGQKATLFKMEMREGQEYTDLFNQAKKEPEEIAFSIDAIGRYIKGEAEGRTGRLVHQLLSLHSLDMVPYGAAGGEALAVYQEAHITTEENQEVTTEMEIKTLEDLKSVDGGKLLESLKKEVAEEVKQEALQEATKQVIAKLKDEGGEKSPEARLLEAQAEHKVKISTLETKLTETKEEVKTAKAETEKIKKEFADFQEALGRKNKIDEIVTELKLNPDLVKSLMPTLEVMRNIEGGKTFEEQVKESLAAWAKPPEKQEDKGKGTFKMSIGDRLIEGVKKPSGDNEEKKAPDQKAASMAFRQ